MHSIGNIRTTAFFAYKLEGELDPMNLMHTKDLKYNNPAKIKTDPRAVLLVDKKPKWSTTKNKYVYNFNGRCSVASVKNTQLLPESAPFITEEGDHSNDECMFQFGRWDKTHFNLDLYYPLSIMNAFCLALAIFDTY